MAKWNIKVSNVAAYAVRLCDWSLRIGANSLRMPQIQADFKL